MRLWSAYTLAKTWKCRPSELYDVEDPYDAFRFDRAVAHFGDALSAELDKVEGKNNKEIEAKRLKILRKWIPEASTATPGRKYRDPAKES